MVNGVPVAIFSNGVPVTTTSSVKVIVTGTTWPALYEPLARVDDTLETDGGMPLS